MTNLAQNGYSHEELMTAFYDKDAIEKSRFKMFVIRNNVKYSEVNFYSISLFCRSDDSIKYGANAEIEYIENIDWVNDRIQLFMETSYDNVNFEWPLSPPLRVQKRSVTIYTSYKYISLELQDELSFLRNNSLSKTIFRYRLTPYVGIISDLFALANFQAYTIYPTDKVLSTDREFEEGTKILNLINELLAEVNYNNLFPQKSGIISSNEYVIPSHREERISYLSGRNGIILEPITISYDTFDKSNVFVGYCTNPEIEEPLRVILENDSPNSSISTVNMGYIITDTPVQYSNIADYETLYDVVFKQKENSMLSYKTISFDSKIVPYHEVNEMLSIQTDDVSGIFEEISWTIKVNSNQAIMTHTARDING